MILYENEGNTATVYLRPAQAEDVQRACVPIGLIRSKQDGLHPLSQLRLPVEDEQTDEPPCRHAHTLYLGVLLSSTRVRSFAKSGRED